MRPKATGAILAFLTGILWFHFAGCVWSESQPILTLQSEAAVLMDAATGQLLFEQNPEKRFPPASLSKMMTLFIAFDAIKRGEVEFDDEVLISKKAWKMGGSQMFLEVGDRVKFIELIKGAAAISANDGALAIAEFLSGSEEVFVHQMNEEAKALGMKNTHFGNPHGLPRKGQYSTSMDMAILGLAYIRKHSDALKFHSLQTYSYGGIEQKNWNTLLTLDRGVDGLKTGYLRKSGYHILFTAKQDGRRLVGVVMGGETAEKRNHDALKLIGYGMKNFSNRTILSKGAVVGTVKVQNGDPSQVDLSASGDLVVTVPKGDEVSIPVRNEIPSSVNPPISKGNILGKVVLEGAGFPRKEIDLIAAQDVQVKSYAMYYMMGLAGAVVFVVFIYSRRRGLKRGR